MLSEGGPDTKKYRPLGCPLCKVLEDVTTEPRWQKADQRLPASGDKVGHGPTGSWGEVSALDRGRAQVCAPAQTHRTGRFGCSSPDVNSQSVPFQKQARVCVWGRGGP